MPSDVSTELSALAKEREPSKEAQPVPRRRGGTMTTNEEEALLCAAVLILEQLDAAEERGYKNGHSDGMADMNRIEAFIKARADERRKVGEELLVAIPVVYGVAREHVRRICKLEGEDD